LTVGDDLEAEEVELGEDKDLAADVDDGVYNDDDEEALESDDEDEDDALKGLDLEEDSEGKSGLIRLSPLLSELLTYPVSLQNLFTSFPSTRYCLLRSR
jgi:ATP-dependent RNA helicase DHX37/DHR1